GVQFHVRDLAEHLRSAGHHAAVLAPAEEETPIPEYMTSVGGAIPVRYNGSVARLSFGPSVAARTGRWLEDGNFDVVHIHEPFAPSVGMIAMRRAECPVVATFHSAQERSRALQAAYPLVRPGLERISARIAVSAAARRTVVEHLGGDALVIPNGVTTALCRVAVARPAGRTGTHQCAHRRLRGRAPHGGRAPRWGRGGDPQRREHRLLPGRCSPSGVAWHPGASHHCLPGPAGRATQGARSADGRRTHAAGALPWSARVGRRPR